MKKKVVVYCAETDAYYNKRILKKQYKNDLQVGKNMLEYIGK